MHELVKKCMDATAAYCRVHSTVPATESEQRELRAIAEQFAREMRDLHIHDELTASCEEFLAATNTFDLPAEFQRASDLFNLALVVILYVFLLRFKI